MRFSSGAGTRAFLLAAALLTFAAPLRAQTIYSMPGDVNGDGTLNISDAILVLRATVGLVKLSIPQLQVADLNHDGKVNTLDVTPLIQKVAGLHPAAFTTRFEALSTLPSSPTYAKKPTLPTVNGIPSSKPNLKSPPSLPVHPPIIPWLPY
jgi:hypothetical protein